MFKSFKKHYKENKEMQKTIHGFLYIIVGYLAITFTLIFGEFIYNIFNEKIAIWIATIPGFFVVYVLGEAIINKFKRIKE